MSEQLKEKRKISRLSLLSVSGLAIIIILGVLNLLSGKNLHSPIFVFLVIVSFFAATGALLEIYRSSEKLKGRVSAIAVIVVICVSLSFYCTMNEPRLLVNECMDKMRSLAVYFQHIKRLPKDPNRWCDFLITQVGASPEFFICPDSDAVEGESSYALNKYLFEKKASESSANIVFLFETNYGKGPARDEPVENRDFFSDPNFDSTLKDRLKGRLIYKDRWNQVGGPEILEAANHQQSKGCNVLYTNGFVEFVEIERIPKLKWTRDGVAPMPAFLLESKKGAVSKGWIAAIAGIELLIAAILVIRCSSKKYAPFAIMISLLSGSISWFFGLLSSVFYLSDKFPQTAQFGGAALGFLTGIIYVTFLANIPEDFKLSKSFRGYTVSAALAACAFCSLIVHLIAMAINRTTNPLGLLSAMPFGIITGLIVGMSSWAFLKAFALEEIVQSTESAEQTD